MDHACAPEASRPSPFSLRPTAATALTVIATVVALAPASAQAQWAATPYPGIRALERTDPGPTRIRAFEVDLCSPGMTVRASTPAEANQTVSRWAGAVDVNVAVNANMWHCGALCGVGIGNGERFAAADDNHWGYLAFMPDDVDYPWDYDTVPPPIWIEQAVGGHPRLVNEGAAMPSFAGNCLERHPRTSAGFSADKSKMIMAVVDGRSSSSRGATCAEMAALMVSLGAHAAINLDGGGSSTAWRADRGVVNVPSDGTQRVVRNHLGVRSYNEGAPRNCASHRPLPAETGVMRPLSPEVSGAFGFSLLDLRLWPAEYIAAYDRGTPVEAPRLVRASGEPAIYLIDHGVKRHVPNPRALLGFHLHDNPVESLTRAAIDAFPTGQPLTQYPYIAVGPAPAHEAFLVDYPLPEPTTPPGPGEDAGTTPPAEDGGANETDAGTELPPIGGETDAGDGDDAADGGTAIMRRSVPDAGGCSAPGTPPVAHFTLALLLLGLVRRRS